MIKYLYWLLLSFILLNLKAQNIDSLKTKLKNAKHDTTRLKLLSVLGEACELEDIPQYSEATIIITKNYGSISLSLRDKYKQYLADAYNNMGFFHQNSANMPLAMKYHNMSLKLRLEVDNKSDIAISFNNIGFINEQTGDINKALENYQKSLAIRETIKDNNGIAESLNNIAVVYEQFGFISKAIDSYYKSLKIIETLNDKKRESSLLNNIGILHRDQGDISKALEFHTKSLELQKTINDKKGIGYTLNNFAVIYKLQGNYKKALNYLNQSLKIREEIKDLKGIGNCLNNIGVIYEKTNELDNALANFNASLKVKNEIDDKIGVTQSLRNIASVLRRQGKINEALKYGQQSFEIAKKLGVLENIKTSANEMKKIYQVQNKYKDAFDMYCIEMQMTDSLVNTETKKASIKKEIQYQYDKKATADSIKIASEKKYTAQLNETKLSKEQNQKLLFASIALLALLSVGFVLYQYKQKQKTNTQLNDINDKINKQNNILKTLNQELIDSEESLQKSNSTKEQLISMMSHDLLNPITAITNYNQQIIHKVTNTSTSSVTSEDLLSAFKNVDAAIQPMHSLLDNMLQWSAIQKDGVTAKLKIQDVAEIVKEIISIYRPQATLKYIKLIDAFDKDFVLNTDKSILSLILRNLLNNAIKYSGNDTQILIATNTVTKTITITDQGFGMTDEMINNLNTKQLNKIQSKGTGLGLKLCFEFAEAINANINFTKNATNGVSVIIKLNAA